MSIGIPSTTIWHSNRYQPDAISIVGTSNGTNVSCVGATSSTSGSIAIGCGGPPAISAARAISIRTWCGRPSAPRNRNAPFTDAGNRS